MTTAVRNENEFVANLLGPASEAISHDIEWREQMTTMSRAENELVANLYGLLSDAISHDIERRSQLRESFIAPVLIYPGGDERYCLNGLTRDISTEGIGLIHPSPLECQEVVINVFGSDEKPTFLFVKIEWCEFMGQGWYVSGGRFIYRFRMTGNETHI